MPRYDGSIGGSPGGSTKIDTTKPDAGTPIIKDDSNKSGWEAIKELIRQSQTGDTVTIDMNGASVVPKDVFDTIKGKDLTVVFELGEGISWSINGQSITDDNLKDINLGVTVDTEVIPEKLINEVAKEQIYRNISLSHNGSFGFDAVLTINMDKKNAGQYVQLFYYNMSTGQLELQYIAKVNENGSVQCNFTHASDYVMVFSKEPMYEKAVEQIAISTDKGTLYIGGTKNKSMNLKPELPDYLKEITEEDRSQIVITYKSSNPKVATVTSAGKIKARKVGKTTITTQVTVGGIKKSFKTTITVKEAYIKLTKSTDALLKGKSYTFKAEGYGVDTKDITFFTSNKATITINKNTGKAVAKSIGTGYILARAGNIEKKIKVEVK